MGDFRIKSLILFFFISFLYADDFISNDEYGAMLYKNPRGIGCIKCHGKKAEGKIIAYYIDKYNKRQVVKAPNITHIKWKDFYYKLKYSKVFRRGKYRVLHYSFMPKYTYLTDIEIKAIYQFIHKH